MTYPERQDIPEHRPLAGLLYNLAGCNTGKSCFRPRGENAVFEDSSALARSPRLDNRAPLSSLRSFSWRVYDEEDDDDDDDDEDEAEDMIIDQRKAAEARPRMNPFNLKRSREAAEPLLSKRPATMKPPPANPSPPACLVPPASLVSPGRPAPLVTPAPPASHEQEMIDDDFFFNDDHDDLLSAYDEEEALKIAIMESAKEASLRPAAPTPTDAPTPPPLVNEGIYEHQKLAIPAAIPMRLSPPAVFPAASVVSSAPPLLQSLSSVPPADESPHTSSTLTPITTSTSASASASASTSTTAQRKGRGRPRKHPQLPQVAEEPIDPASASPPLQSHGPQKAKFAPLFYTQDGYLPASLQDQLRSRPQNLTIPVDVMIKMMETIDIARDRERRVWVAYIHTWSDCHGVPYFLNHVRETDLCQLVFRLFGDQWDKHITLKSHNKP